MILSNKKAAALFGYGGYRGYGDDATLSPMTPDPSLQTVTFQPFTTQNTINSAVPTPAFVIPDSPPWMTIFDPGFYMTSNPDLAAVLGPDPATLFNHFKTYGIKEGRQAHPTWWTVWYLARYPDLQAAFGTGGPDAYARAVDHWFANGIKEGRIGSNPGAPSPITGGGGAPPVKAGTYLGKGGGGADHYADGAGHIFRPSVPGETNRAEGTGTLLTLYPTDSTFTTWGKGSDGRWYYIPWLADMSVSMVPDPASGAVIGATLAWNGEGTPIPPPMPLPVDHPLISTVVDPGVFPLDMIPSVPVPVPMPASKIPLFVGIGAGVLLLSKLLK